MKLSATFRKPEPTTIYDRIGGHEHSRHHDFSAATFVAERLDDPQILRLFPN